MSEARASRDELCEAYQNNLRDIMPPGAVIAHCLWSAYVGGKLRGLSDEEAIESCREFATECSSAEEADSVYDTCPAGIVMGSTCTATVQALGDCLEARWNWLANSLEGLSGCEDGPFLAGDAGDALYDEFLELDECADSKLPPPDCSSALSSEQWPIDAIPFPE